MADRPTSGNPLLDAWMAAPARLLEAQAPFMDQVSALMGGKTPETVSRAQENWDLCNRQLSDWLKSSRRWFGMSRDGVTEPEGVAEETLRRMMDPSRLLYAGSDEVNRAIQRLVEGPEFADIGTLERQLLKATKEWLALREASAAYRGVVAGAWTRAFETFSKDLLAKPPTTQDGARSVLDRWLATANDELIRTQRTDEFLTAQRRLLRAGVDYRLKERELVEVWCETHSIPTRTEIDDLHKTVHTLNRRVRALEKQLKASAADSRRAAAPRRKAPKRQSKTGKE